MRMCGSSKWWNVDVDADKDSHFTDVHAVWRIRILLWTADVDVWSNSVDWGGLNFTIRTSLLTAHHAGIGMALSSCLLSCRPPTSSSAETGRMFSGQSTNETTWVVSDVTTLTVTRNWSSCRNVICVYWTARQHPLTGRLFGPFGRHQMNVLEIIIVVLHCFGTDGVLAYVHLCNWCCEFGLCRWATHVWDMPPHDREMRNVTSVDARSLLLGLLSYMFPFWNTRLSIYWDSRCEWC